MLITLCRIDSYLYYFYAMNLPCVSSIEYSSVISRPVRYYRHNDVISGNVIFICVISRIYPLKPKTDTRAFVLNINSLLNHRRPHIQAPAGARSEFSQQIFTPSLGWFTASKIHKIFLRCEYTLPLTAEPIFCLLAQTLRYSFNRGNSNSEILYRSVCDAKTINDLT